NNLKTVIMKKYTCPMHPQILKDEPGKCPLCGMALVPFGKTSGHNHNHHEHGEHQHSAHQHDKHEGHHTLDFLKRFWVSLIITVPILLLSPMVQEWFGFTVAFPGDKYVLLALGTFIYIYGGMPFLKGIVGEIKAKAIGMMTLVAIAISVAYIYSVAVVFGVPGVGLSLYHSSLFLMMLLGIWLGIRYICAASKALHSMVALLPNDGTVERNCETKKTKLEVLKNGQTIIIQPREKIPADGTIV